MLPRTALTQGVHPAARAEPNKNDVMYLDLNFVFTANITENPSTKKTAFRKISSLLGFVSASDEPARYAKNPGTIGSMHGLRKETIPAMNAIMIDSSAIYAIEINCL